MHIKRRTEMSTHSPSLSPLSLGSRRLRPVGIGANGPVAPPPPERRTPVPPTLGTSPSPRSTGLRRASTFHVGSGAAKPSLASIAMTLHRKLQRHRAQKAAVAERSSPPPTAAPSSGSLSRIKTMADVLQVRVAQDKATKRINAIARLKKATSRLRHIHRVLKRGRVKTEGEQKW